MTASIETIVGRARNLVFIWPIAIGVSLVSCSNEIDRPDAGNPAIALASNNIESPVAAPAAPLLQIRLDKRASQVPSICGAVPPHDPPPIAIIRFYEQESDFARPLKAAIERIATLKEEVSFELRVMIPSSYLEDRENIDVATPKKNIDSVKNSLISLGISELDMVYTARKSDGISVYEVHVFALEICDSAIEGSEPLLEIRSPSMDGVLPSARASAMRA
jgi:hypothetical protein